MDGLLIVNKPPGMTSHDIVLFVRRKFAIKKVGHTGILDPMATGVLILVLGRATKITSVLIDQDKEYQAVMHLGITTHTQDKEGQIIEEKNIDSISLSDIKKAIMSFEGEIDQIPPMVSARRHQGKRLYELARKGIIVERTPKKINIHEIEIDWIKPPLVSFRVSCTKGTYVRTLCHDIGMLLGVGAHLHLLERTKSGPFSVKNAVSWENLQKMSIDDLRQNILPLSPVLYKKLGTPFFTINGIQP
ncbi:MAG: tRNA pseudouridine(55) synthase TruB [Chlamydiota bacterium]|nr:tRNA pseudouridine(55) synthase TruB [Chlamydiota bacterium]